MLLGSIQSRPEIGDGFLLARYNLTLAGKLICQHLNADPQLGYFHLRG